MADSSVQASDQQGSSGAIFSTDLVGGEHVPLSKLAFGAYGTVNLVTSTASNAFPVALSDIDNAVLDVIAADTTSLDGKVTACDTGAVVIASGTVTTVSTVTNLVQMNGVNISLNTGVRDVGTQRVTIATDDVVPASQSGTWNIANISGTVSLPTDAATETTLSGLLTDTELRATPVVVDLGANNDVTIDAAAVTSLALIDNPVVAHDAAVSGSTGVSVAGFEARATEPTATADADATRGMATTLGKQIVLPHSIPASTWNYATATLGVTDTADDVAKAAAGAGIRNYVTSCQVINGHATVATEVVIKDGSTVIWRGWAEAVGGGVSAKFDPPLRGTANTAINVANITNGSKTYFNLQGYVAGE